MHISKVTIRNYKSVFEVRDFALGPGLNVIVGRNNVGKTAILEALSLSFDDKRHRSRRTAPLPSSSVNNLPSVEVSFSLDSGALATLLHDVLSDLLTVPLDPTWPMGQVPIRLAAALAAAREFRCDWAPGRTCTRADFDTYPIPDFPCKVVGLRMRGNSSSWQFEFLETNPQPYTIQDQRRGETFADKLAHHLAQSVYYFHAERLKVGVHRFGSSMVLSQDASNLPQVLLNLATSNPARFAHLVNTVRRVLPDVQGVSVKPVDDSRVEIRVWPEPMDLQREDLSVPLLESGTGIAQVLAMLYVVMNSDSSKVILIDEPSSFLHPGAVRVLLEVFVEYSQHQFVITTHTPAAVSATQISSLTLVRRVNAESVLDVVSIGEARGLAALLAEVGVRLSDVFGADRILWVEGRT